jgi:lipoate-protein ligase A
MTGKPRTSNLEHPTSNVPANRSLKVGSWFFLNSGKGDPAFNMALDEALLENAARLKHPVLRFYGWTEAAATFGYFQKYSEVERATRLRPLIRRPTGGGIVPHDADWTYSVAVPPGHEWHSLAATESYRRIHEWIQHAFAELKIATELAPQAHKAASPIPGGACFVGYEKFDLLWHGKKIAGAAQRRNRLGLLIQGSVQPPPVTIARSDWEHAMLTAGEKAFGIVWQSTDADALLLAEAERLTAAKFSRKEYNQKQ